MTATPRATCPVCGTTAPLVQSHAPDRAEVPWLAPAGWIVSSGAVGWVCSPFCQSIGIRFGLGPGNRRPADDYLATHG